MSKYQENLREICLIVNKRNELQKNRNSARHKVIRLEGILNSMRKQVEKRKLERTVDRDRNPECKFYFKLQAEVDSKHFPSHEARAAYRSLLYKMQNDISNNVEAAEMELDRYAYKYIKRHPDKYDKMSRHEIKTMLQKQVYLREKAMYEIMEHTEETTKKLRKLLKENKMRLSTDNNGGIYSIREEDGHHIYRDQIKKIAFDVTIEEGLAGE